MKNWRGWTGLTRIRADQTRGKKDWHECIDYQKEIETGILSGKNQYLDDEFEKTANAYIEQLEKLSMANYELHSSISGSKRSIQI